MNFDYDYVAFRDGKVIALCVDDTDDPKWTAKQVADFIRTGCTVKRMSLEEVRAIPRDQFFRHEPKPEQMTLGVSR